MFTVPWVGLQCVIVVFPDHTHLLLHEISTPAIAHIKMNQIAGAAFNGGA